MKKIIITIISIHIATIFFGQQGTDASGGLATGAGGSVSYSVGQIDYITSLSLNGIITQGLQQPYEILLITEVNESRIDLNISVYPNPTVDNLSIIIKNSDIQNMSYSIIDTYGKIIVDEKIISQKTTVLMNDFVNGIYFIKVLNNNIEARTFKLIKNK
jgi:hypothetical protein